MIKDEEIGKYKKRTDSNVSKANRKAKHKHTNIKCLFYIKSRDMVGRPYERYCPASYCNICGKVKNVWFFETKKVEDGYYKSLSNKEILEKYKDLDIIEVSDLFIKYIPIKNS